MHTAFTLNRVSLSLVLYLVDMIKCGISSRLSLTPDQCNCHLKVGDDSLFICLDFEVPSPFIQ